MLLMWRSYLLFLLFDLNAEILGPAFEMTVMVVVAVATGNFPCCSAVASGCFHLFLR